MLLNNNKYFALNKLQEVSCFSPKPKEKCRAKKLKIKKLKNNFFLIKKYWMKKISCRHNSF